MVIVEQNDGWIFTLGIGSVRESVSDSGYGHEDISSIDIHVGILLECVFVFTIMACALRWGVILVGDYYYWALLTP